MPIRYQTYLGLPPDPLLSATLNLLVEVFPALTEPEILAEIAYQQVRTPVLAGLALDDNQVVGCKLGYEQKPGHFYSWLGCVSPSCRGQGIAAELMRQQHDWCKEQGYHTIRTHTYNQWRHMLVLNIRSGYDIIGTVAGKRGLTIVLEKTL
ncbi:GNAT family N-acetyltransferase [Spirosoma utsteinense]|uniref:GNAT superfamily N-acetyltransferase n=1 Tax=Spirosoma utsteinense TaxID=2585773 RepID=A0ABR6W9R2_9BACT|nr:GNAT family N-acetyltransferase [Spirosoma utsteinense]MBC3786747.1 GNAT superfamily N-acetyltransferase [Spirosoma utsteinense]MBC3793311.1 GNAT superfamily N-acetyltransferase [Spirosoma utsteinense]